MTEKTDKDFRFAISLSVLNHLGRNLYRNFVTVLGEAISNAWDADAENVWIEIDKNSGSFSIKDDGTGMNAEEFQQKFLKIGYSKRAKATKSHERKRPYIGAKGIGKLALLSCAERVSVISKKEESEYIGGVIDNSGLDDAITSDLTPEEYPLEDLNWELLDELTSDHEQGTIVFFENAKDPIRHSIAHIRKMLAMSFAFSLIDEEFTIQVNGEIVGIEDIRDVLDATEFVWIMNSLDNDFTKSLDKLKSSPVKLTTTLGIKGFVGSVEKPRNLKITGTEDRATIDLFVNGRLREKNILRHIPTQRVVESYLYGQIHFDDMDVGDSNDPFTSSREGVVEDDKNFQALLDYLKREALPRIFDQWDEMRLKRGKEGDEENNRKTKKERKARDLYSAARDEYEPDESSPNKDKVDEWLTELREDAEFNISSYVDCFLSENLVRKYLTDKKVSLPDGVKKEADQWRDREAKRLAEANISFSVRKSDDDLSYLGMDALAVSVEGNKDSGSNQTLWSDAVSYRPVRNVVGHTGLLTDNAKSHLKLKYENIKARIRTLFASTS